MKKIGCILFAALLAGCNLLEEPQVVTPPSAPEGERVQIHFKVAVPDGGAETKAMGLNPTIDPDGFYIAVFGGSGYFNEWVNATVESATANYDNTSATVYSLSAKLSVSDSRLRLHFIANCPTAIRNNPPISGSQDTEDNVMSKIRSQLGDTYNDGYWQKLVLPKGVRAEKEFAGEGDEEGVWVATAATMAQFPNPIVLVRNFARVYLRNLTPTYYVNNVADHQLVTIKAFGLAYAPSEGTIAPLLSAPYTCNAQGAPITVADNDNTTTVFYENFFINYQNYPIESDDANATLLTGPPFNYEGYSPEDQAYNYYPANADAGVPVEANLKAWDSTTPENNVLFVYERTMPSSARRATRVIIKAERKDESGVSEGDKFYALDIVNLDGVSIPLLRNQTYTVHLLNIEAGSGESQIDKASKASSATVSGDPTFQNLINISDGKSSIGTSFTEKFYVQPEEDFVMFRYLPTNVNETYNGVDYVANKEYPDLVNISVGTVNLQTGVFTALTPTEAANQGVLSFAVENGEYKVWIVKDNNDKAVQYIRANNTWNVATDAQIADSNLEKWGMIRYQLNETYKDSDNYFTQERTQAIHVVGTFSDREMSRNVVIKTSPRQTMSVSCQQKYVLQKSGETEVVRILIPTGLSRSVFPLEFDIEPDGYSLTPDGDALPVAYGTSIIPGNNHPSYYFVKTLTQTMYDALPTTTENGATWKVFDCHFKTTVANNACTVYVHNRYFNEASAFDSFSNFVQRQFTNLSLTSSMYRHANTQMTFVMDAAHSTPVVWWDPNNTLGASTNAAEAKEKGLSSSNRVLPPIITVEMVGFTPKYQEDGETPVTSGLEHSSGNKYHYYVGTGTPTSDMASVTLDLTALGAVGTDAYVVLSTENITDNPELYATATSSNTRIQGGTFTTYQFNNSNNYTMPLGKDQSTTFKFTYTSGMVIPITIIMDGVTLNGTDSRMSDEGNGVWTFTPTSTSTTTYTINVKSTTRFSPVSITLSSEDYTDVTRTANRSTSFTVPKNSLYFRDASGDGNPTDFTRNSTVVYLNNSTAYSSLASTNSNGNDYYNKSDMTVNVANFSIVNDDAIVYFIYRSSSYTYYYAKSTLSALSDATSSNRVTLRFKAPITINTNNSYYSTTNLSYTSGGITVAFNRISYVSNSYLDLNSGSTYTMTVSSTAGPISNITVNYYADTYAPNSVNVSSGTYTYSSGVGTWSDSSDSVTFTITPKSSYETSLKSIAVSLED